MPRNLIAMPLLGKPTTLFWIHLVANGYPCIFICPFFSLIYLQHGMKMNQATEKLIYKQPGPLNMSSSSVSKGWRDRLSMQQHPLKWLQRVHHTDIRSPWACKHTMHNTKSVILVISTWTHSIVNMLNYQSGSLFISLAPRWGPALCIFTPFWGPQGFEEGLGSAQGI